MKKTCPPPQYMISSGYVTSDGLTISGNFRLIKPVENIEQLDKLLQVYPSVFARHKMYPSKFLEHWPLVKLRKWIDLGWMWEAIPEDEFDFFNYTQTNKP